MPEEEPQESHPIIRKLLPFTTAAVVIAMLYVGWIFFSRWQGEREARSKAAQQQVEDARKTVEAYGNGRVKILSFTISQGVIRRRDKASICYGVSNAKTVTIDPKPTGELWPSLSRCVEIAPLKATTYTLTATDAAGHTEQSALTIQVQ